MSVVYFKRHKMELRLDQLPDDQSISLPDEFQLVPWTPKLLNKHAQVKWESFRHELDAHVFPCLSDLDGCRQLMREIAGRKNFLPEATWLACRRGGLSGDLEPCGTIQGLLAAGKAGAIQNLGVHPTCRDLGLGSLLLRHALQGFRAAGCRFANLEVTVQNRAAIRLYERFGFRHVETIFKVADVQFAS